MLSDLLEIAEAIEAMATYKQMTEPTLAGQLQTHAAHLRDMRCLVQEAAEWLEGLASALEEDGVMQLTAAAAHRLAVRLQSGVEEVQ